MNTAPQTELFSAFRFFPAERDVFRKKEILTPSQWAEKYRQVNIGAHVGSWRNSISPHLVEIMDTWALPYVREVVVCKSPQTGGTEAMYNCMGYAMDRDPSTLMMVMPAQDVARKVAEDRIIPMIETSLKLKELVSENPDDTAKQRVKLRNGALLYMAWSNSASALATFPIKHLFFDETDKYPAMVGKETDPISLGEKRARTFRYTHKVFKVSTPTREDMPIWKAFSAADVELRYFTRCPSCGHEQMFRLDNLKYPEGIAPEEVKRDHLARYECEDCKTQWTDSQKDSAVRAGRWKRTRGEHVSRPRSVAFHLPSWISPDVSLSEIAAAYLVSKSDKIRLIDFYNDYLAEPFIESESGESVAADVLYARRHEYGPEDATWKIPMNACVLTAFTDVQNNRLETEVVAWGPGRESWGVERRFFMGDPATDEKPWIDLDEYLAREWIHESGARLRVSAAGVDSGYLAGVVYRFVRPRQARRIYACKGASTRGKPLISIPSTKAVKGQLKDKFKVSLITIGTETGKDILFSWMQVEAAGPGYMHYHEGYDWNYYRQLTSEHAVTRYEKGGRPYRVWEKKHRDARNEALDIRVGNLAMIELLNPNFEELAKGLKAIAAGQAPTKQSGRRVLSQGVQA